MNETIKELQGRVEYLEDQLGMLTDLVAESKFRERIKVLEDWADDVARKAQEVIEELESGIVEEVVFVPSDEWFRDKTKDN